MSGQKVAYHLRPNKFVERILFVELLGLVGQYHPMGNYAYISMGGRYLEDSKLVHDSLGLKNLVSLEGDETVLKRQEFNRPLSLIRCLPMKTGEFIRDFENHQIDIEQTGTTNYAVWLDFANARGRAPQLKEFQTLIGKLGPKDIVKITLNANPETVFGEIDYEEPGFSQKAGDSIKRALGDYAPPRQIQVDDTNKVGFARILRDATASAAKQGMKNKWGSVFHPLSVFRYNDAFHSMMTFTGIIVNKVDVGKLEEESGLKDWEFYYRSEEICEIAIPDLSIKEKIHIDQQLHSNTPEAIHAELPFKFDQSDNISLDILKSYIRHYSRYPQYMRVVL